MSSSALQSRRATIAEGGVDCVLEVGRGYVLARLWREAHPAIQGRSVDEFREAETAAAWVLDRLS